MSLGTWLTTWLRALRWKQWIKNALVFLPLFFAHKWGDPVALQQGLLVFGVFCAAASSIYLVNDLMDHAADEAHPQKRLRPLAAGLISRRSAWLTSALLLAGSVVVAAQISQACIGILVLYVVAANAYSLALKAMLMLDVMLLAGFYTLRIFAGSVATDTPVSKWLLLFSLFFFVGLAFQKRTAELRGWSDGEEHSNRRSYGKSDLEHLRTAGTVSSYLALLVLALYIQSPDVTTHYARPDVLWWIVPCLLYWTSRVWLLAGRDQVSEDAIAFAFKDVTSYLLGGLVVIIMILAQPI